VNTIGIGKDAITSGIEVKTLGAHASTDHNMDKRGSGANPIQIVGKCGWGKVSTNWTRTLSKSPRLSNMSTSKIQAKAYHLCSHLKV